jgi:hypothetical protein
MDLSYNKRKFYSAMNCILVKCRGVAEPVKLHLVQSFCLPLLTYCFGALDYTKSELMELNTCWNDAFRKIFGYKRFESVKEFMYFCGVLDLKHVYDLARFKFVISLDRKLPYFRRFFVMLDWQYHLIDGLLSSYDVMQHTQFYSAVYKHFSVYMENRST